MLLIVVVLTGIVVSAGLMLDMVMVSRIDQFSLGPIGIPIGDVMKRGGGLTPKSEVRLGGMEGANGLFPMGGKRGVMVLEGGRVLARGTGCCT